MAVLPVHARQVDPVFQNAAAGGDSFQNDGATEILILNTGIDDVLVTAAAARRCSQGFLDNWVKNCPAGQVQRFGPFLPNRFNDSGGSVTVTYADETVLQVAVQRQK